MRWFRGTKVDFIGRRYIFIVLSALMIFVSAFSIISKRGLNLGIDFTGGILVQIKFSKPVDLNDLRRLLMIEGISNFELQSFPLHNSVVIRIKGTEVQLEKMSTEIKDIISETDSELIIERTEFVGPRIGEHLTRMALWSIVLSFLGIIVYVAFRFKSVVWGVAGIIALVHDVFITLGLFSLLNKEIDLTIIAALLTLAGYSINDSIVIFDRIRENLTLLRRESLGKIINSSINQVISRTVITSLTTELVLVALFFLGGNVIHGFSLALLFGIIVGTYSSIFIASPIVYEWMSRRIK